VITAGFMTSTARSRMVGFAPERLKIMFSLRNVTPGGEPYTVTT
jgi:hypothetical protein